MNLRLQKIPPLLPVVAFLDNALFDNYDVTATKMQAKVRTLVGTFSGKMGLHGNSSGSNWGPTELLLKRIVDFARTKKEKTAELKASTAALKADQQEMEVGLRPDGGITCRSFLR